MLVSHASWGWLPIQVGIAFLFSYSPKVAQEGFEPPFRHITVGVHITLWAKESAQVDQAVITLAGNDGI